MDHIDILRLSQRHLKIAASYAPNVNGSLMAFFLADVACALEKNDTVRGNAMYAIEKAMMHLHPDVSCLTILMDAIQILEMKIWMSSPKLSP